MEKNHFSILVVLAVLLLVSLTGCTSTPATLPQDEPKKIDIPAPIQNPRLGDVFELQLNQSARIQGTNTTVFLRKLIDAPCMLVVSCNWTGKAVHVVVDDGTTITRAELVSANLSVSTPSGVLGLVQSDFQTKAALAFFPPGTVLKPAQQSLTPERVFTGKEKS